MRPVHRTPAPEAMSVWTRIGRRVVERHVVDAFERSLDTPLPQFPVAEHVRLCPIGSGCDFSALPVTQQRVARENLSRGDAGWMALIDGRVAGWLWVSRTSHLDRWSGLRINLGPDEAYTYGWWVAPEHRKDGIAAALMSTLLSDLAAVGGVRRVYAWVDRDNKTSQFQLRLLFGFTKTQEVERVRVLDRWGRAVRGSAQPEAGPLSCSRR